MKKLITLIALTFSLQGCIFIAGAAVGAAAIAGVYDHRKVAQVIRDEHIANTASDSIKSIPELNTSDTHIVVLSYNKVVLLAGETSTAALRQQAEDIVRTNIPDIKRIYNQISLMGPTSSLTRTSDSWITTKIKTQMLATKDLKSSSIGILTENGAVYLMGTVTPEQAELAVEIARNVSGVQKVVKIFEYQKPQPEPQN